MFRALICLEYLLDLSADCDKNRQNNLLIKGMFLEGTFTLGPNFLDPKLTWLDWTENCAFTPMCCLV